MAGRTLNRRQLREQADQAAQSEAVAAGAVPVEATPNETTRAKAPAAAKARQGRAKKKPARMQARWGIFDGGMKQVAVFDYAQRAAADQMLADLLAKKKGVHFLQLVKEPMPEPAPAEPAGPGA